MITPKFEIEQNDDFLLIKIYTPHIKLSMIEYIISEKTFRFYVKPYFLRLTFEQEISEETINDGDDESESEEKLENLKYNSDTGSIEIKIKKKNKSEFFTNLNMLTMLMSTKKEELKKKPLIEMIDNEEESIINGEEEEEDTDSLLNDNFEFFEQKINSFDEMKIEDDLISISKITYGFDSRYE